MLCPSAPASSAEGAGTWTPLPIEFWDGHTEFLPVLSSHSPDQGRRQWKTSPSAFSVQGSSVPCLRRSTEAAGSRSTAVFGNKKHRCGVRKAVGSVVRAGGLLGKGCEWPYSALYGWIRSYPHALGLTACTSSANGRGLGLEASSQPVCLPHPFSFPAFYPLRSDSPPL